MSPCEPSVANVRRSVALSHRSRGCAPSTCSVEMAVIGVGLRQVRRVAGSRLRYRAPLEDDATGEGAEGDTCLERGGTGISADEQSSRGRYAQSKRELDLVDGVDDLALLSCAAYNPPLA
jgi:hypothetical protein